MLRLKRKTVKERSTLQEKKVADEVSGKVVPASGALDNFKGDVRSLYFLLECKTTEKDYYVLTLKTWDKIKKEALKDGLREPLMQVDLKDGKCKRLCILEYDSFDYLIPEKDWKDYLKDQYIIKGKSIRLKDVGVYVWHSYHDKKVIVVDWEYFLSTLCSRYDESIIPNF